MSYILFYFVLHHFNLGHLNSTFYDQTLLQSQCTAPRLETPSSFSGQMESFCCIVVVEMDINIEMDVYSFHRFSVLYVSVRDSNPKENKRNGASGGGELGGPPQELGVIC